MSMLVVGATGSVGQQVATGLQRRAGRVRALVRGGFSNAKAGPLEAAGVALVDGDLTRPETLDAACAGVDTIVCTATSMPSAPDNGLRRVDHDGVLALVDAAERAGVRRFVYTSYSGNLRIPSPLETAKRACEDRLLRSAVQAVILRPSYFMEVWLGPHLGFDPAAGTVRIYGSGEAKGSYISAVDVASFAVAAALRDTPADAVLEMGGPEALSQLDAVRIFESVFDRPFALQFVPVEALRVQHQSADPLQQTFGALMLGYQQGDVIPGAADLAKEYGVELRSVAEHARAVRAQAAGV